MVCFEFALGVVWGSVGRCWMCARCVHDRTGMLSRSLRGGCPYGDCGMPVWPTGRRGTRSGPVRCWWVALGWSRRADRSASRRSPRTPGLPSPWLPPLAVRGRSGNGMPPAGGVRRSPALMRSPGRPRLTVDPGTPAVPYRANQAQTVPKRMFTTGPPLSHNLGDPHLKVGCKRGRHRRLRRSRP